jgi:hypothetical protein
MVHLYPCCLASDVRKNFGEEFRKLLQSPPNSIYTAKWQDQFRIKISVETPETDRQTPHRHG